MKDRVCKRRSCSYNRVCCQHSSRPGRRSGNSLSRPDERMRHHRVTTTINATPYIPRTSYVQRSYLSHKPTSVKRRPTHTTRMYEETWRMCNTPPLTTHALPSVPGHKQCPKASISNEATDKSNLSWKARCLLSCSRSYT